MKQRSVVSWSCWQTNKNMTVVSGRDGCGYVYFCPLCPKPCLPPLTRYSLLALELSGDLLFMNLRVGVGHSNKKNSAQQNRSVKKKKTLTPVIWYLYQGGEIIHSHEMAQSLCIILLCCWLWQLAILHNRDVGWAKMMSSYLPLNGDMEWCVEGKRELLLVLDYIFRLHFGSTPELQAVALGFIKTQRKYGFLWQHTNLTQAFI